MNIICIWLQEAQWQLLQFAIRMPSRRCSHLKFDSDFRSSCENKVTLFEDITTRWSQSWPFDLLVGGLDKPLKGSLNHLKNVRENCQAMFFAKIIKHLKKNDVWMHKTADLFKGLHKVFAKTKCRSSCIVQHRSTSQTWICFPPWTCHVPRCTVTGRLQITHFQSQVICKPCNKLRWEAIHRYPPQKKNDSTIWKNVQKKQPDFFLASFQITTAWFSHSTNCRWIQRIGSAAAKRSRRPVKKWWKVGWKFHCKNCWESGWKSNTPCSTCAFWYVSIQSFTTIKAGCLFSKEVIHHVSWQVQKI